MDVKSSLCLCTGPRVLCRPSSSGRRAYGRQAKSIGVRRVGAFRSRATQRLVKISCANGDVGVAENHGPVSSSASSSSDEIPSGSPAGEKGDLGDVKAAIAETIGEMSGLDLGPEAEAAKSDVADAEASSESTETPVESVAEGDEGASTEKSSDVSSSGSDGTQETEERPPQVHRNVRRVPPPTKADCPFAVGDVVVGMVKWSGNGGSKVDLLDYDYEGFCQLRNAPVDLRDDIAMEFDLHRRRPMKPGLVRQFKIISIPDDCKPGGKGPLLGARELDKNVNNQRLTQIMEVCRRDREVVKSHMVGINSGGVKCTLIGIPSFLPRSHCKRESPDYIEDAEMQETYVGKHIPVALVGIDRLKDRVVVSEMRAIESNAMRSIQPGALVWGTVRRMQEWGAFVGIDDTQMSCLLHISNISQAIVNDIQDVFQEGDRVCAVVISMEEDFKRVSLSTADLEESAGDMLVDKEKVYANAPAAVEQIQKEIEAQRAQFLEQQEHEQ
ncbi:hypothetical protein BSKO_08107 [Bryopsis sp. KO-2023]|nr:hypothetical protein BSKO_08107 [Bryopsis sp. KO-2023]